MWDNITKDTFFAIHSHVHDQHAHKETYNETTQIKVHKTQVTKSQPVSQMKTSTAQYFC